MDTEPQHIARNFREPDFSRASIRFAEAVSAQLIVAADRARPQWQKLALAHADALAGVRQSTIDGRPLFHTPLVRQFTETWVLSMDWPVAAQYSDGIQMTLPRDVVAGLRDAGRVESVKFFLADLREVCLGRLGSNDHNLEYGLFINAPIWINLAVVPEFSKSFAKQIRMTVFHETGHFRWFKNGLRSEHLAHARGVAALRSVGWPSTKDQMEALLMDEYPEAWHNEEIRSLVKDTKGGVRLVKAWGEKIVRVSSESI